METQVTFHNLPPSPAIEALVRKKAEALLKYYPRITSCRTRIEVPHQRAAKLFHVRIELGVPSGRVIVRGDAGDDESHKDVRVAVRDAFRAARREVQDHARRLRADVKRHAEVAMSAQVSSLRGDHGFLRTPDGREIYFHENSVRGSGFDHLAEGDAVRFVEEQGDKGPQASTVQPLDRHERAFPARVFRSVSPS